MKKRFHLLRFVLSIILLLNIGTGVANAQGPDTEVTPIPKSVVSAAFTYQGKLALNGTPVNAVCQAAFRLYDSPSDGSELGALTTTITIAQGLFTQPLDFGTDVFNGDARWLGVAVQCSGDAGFSDLGRQALTAAPYALTAINALNVPWSGIRDMPTGFADGIDNDTTYSAGIGLDLDGTQFSLNPGYRLPQTCVDGQVSAWNGSTWVCSTVASSGITGVYSGAGLTGGGASGEVTLTVSFAGTGAANTSARSDHNHNGAYSLLGHTHAGSDITSAVAQALSATTAITATYAASATTAITATYATSAGNALSANQAGSVPWSGITGMPAGFADGVDNNTTYAAGIGLDLNSITLSISSNYRLPQSCANGQGASWNGSAWICSDAASGDITGVNAVSGLTGGGASGQVTLSISSTYRLPQACVNGQVALWNGTDWVCSAPANGDITGVYAGTGLTGGGPGSEVTLTMAYGAAAGTAVQGNQAATLTAGSGLSGGTAADALGDGVTAAFAVGAGNGITTSADAVALGTLTANWSQPGAFDIVLNNASSELQILESAGSTYYGTFDVGDLSANQTYLFTAGGTVWTSGNDGTASTLDADLLDGLNSTAFAISAHTHMTLTAGTGLSGGAYNGGTAITLTVAYGIAAGTAVQGNQAANLAAGSGLTGGTAADSLGDGVTATFNVGAGNGVTATADTVALGTLTANWNQPGAFDIVLNNTSSELQILESTGSTYYGTFDVGDLSANQTYLFTTGGTVWTSGNDGTGSTLDADLLDGLNSSALALAAHTHMTLTAGAGLSGGPYNGSTAVTMTVAYGTAAGTAVQGNQTAILTAGNGLTGGTSADALGDGVTATFNVGAGNGITTTADTVALGTLTANWNQPGAFDIVLNNASSELQILESSGSTYYGTFDVGDLSANQTYAFTTGGTVWTSGNDGASSTLDADLLDGQHASSFTPAGTTWNLGGNAGTNPAANYLGTSDAVTLTLGVNGSRLVYLTPNGNLGLGTSTPDEKLTVKGSARVQGNLYAPIADIGNLSAGQLFVVTDTIIGRNTTISGSLSVGKLSVVTDTTIGRNASISGSLSVGKLSVVTDTTIGRNATISGSLTVSQSAVISGNMTVQGSLYARTSITTVTGTTTLHTNQAGVVLVDSSAYATITLPSAASAKGLIFTIKRLLSTGVVLINSAGGTIDGSAGQGLGRVYDYISVISDGANWYIIDQKQ